MKTRYQEQHEGITTVHPIPLNRLDKKKARRPSAARKKAAQQRKQREAQISAPQVNPLKEYIQKNGVPKFLAQLYNGGVPTASGYMGRLDVLGLLNHNKGFRGYVSGRWRKENDHHHEWIPCTYLNMIVKKAIVANDFRYIWLAYVMRSPTEDIIFNPRLENRVTVGGVVYKILQAHPGGLNFRIPGGDPLGAVPAGQGPADRASLIDRQREFHDSIIQTLRDASSPRNLIARMRAVYVSDCWNGNFPINTIPGRAEIWPYYYEHGNAINVWPAAGGVAAAPPAAAPLAHAAAAHGRVIAAFNQWDNDVQARTKGNTSFA